MRLGGPLFNQDHHDADAWMRAVRAQGYRATYCPLAPEADDATVNAWIAAAKKHDVVIAEVGAWSNPISSDAATAQAAIDKCKKHLALAERVGARCCVNIAGSRGQQWDGPHPDNLSDATFDLTVAVVRQIIDAVRPTRTCYSLEPMPWVFPDSPQSYLRLLRAIDRKAFGVHLDPVNMINCPSRCYRSGDFLRECFAQLGPRIRACHAKDITISGKLTLHLDECRPGTGVLDYRAFLTEMAKLDPDTPLMLEHLPEPEYRPSADYIRGVAAELKVGL
jgi:sugar phosphate isomerase/epimerase